MTRAEREAMQIRSVWVMAQYRARTILAAKHKRSARRQVRISMAEQQAKARAYLDEHPELVHWAAVAVSTVNSAAPKRRR